MRRRLLLIPAAVIVAGIAFLAAVKLQIGNWAGKALPLAAPADFVIETGDSLTDVAHALLRAGIVDSARAFSWRALERNLQGSLKSGEYRALPGETADGLLDRLVARDVLRHPFRLPEGGTVADVLERLRAEPRLRFDLDGARAQTLPAQLGIGGGARAEGRFFPDTYLFERGDSASSVLRRAHERMEAVLASAWDGRSADLWYQRPEQALILASLVEKETALAADRPRIAGVFLRRLERGMRLQSDPTVIYALGERFNGNLRRADLDAESPYNTYRNAGLPPTPICLPSRASIHAALHPAAGAALYFVARGDGSSQFSATLREHNAAVRRYQTARRRPDA